MDEDMLQGALRFWVDKRVLRQVETDAYVVLETLEHDDGAALADREDDASSLLVTGGAATGAEEAGRGGDGLSAQERERREIYWRFIVGMLTNSGPAMPLSQMAMMMKMLIPDGFPWSNEELQEFLAEKVGGQELELAGGKYRLPKK